MNQELEDLPELEKVDTQKSMVVQPQQSITPMVMLQQAVSMNADLAKIEKLMDLQDRYEKREALKAYTVALSNFKAMQITIGKDKHVSFATSKGQTDYRHATLGNVCNVIGAALAEHGLSYRWGTSQEGGKISVTCYLTHILGHGESITLTAGADETGGKNSIQAIGSAVSYLERYTLLAITGTATQENEDDGRNFTADDIVDESQLCDFIAAIDAATTQAEMTKPYLMAISIASEKGDQEAMDRLNVAKNNAFARINK